MRTPSAAALLLVAVAAFPAAGQLTADEVVCQQAASRELRVFVQKKIRCLVACDRKALRDKVPATECLSPFAGDTRACVDKAATKALTKMATGCADDCPECYADGDCGPHAAAILAEASGAVDFVVPLVRCNDAGSPDGLTKTEAKVRQQTALVVGKFINTYERCLGRCRKREAVGKAEAGSCTALEETDAKTVECLTKVVVKALDFLEDPELDAPECLEPELSFAAVTASGHIGDFDPRLFCASPGGAFLDDAD